MQIEMLKVFCDVARLKSFSLAAAENEMSQSGASTIVLLLERRLGVKLISRAPRPLRLTPLGQIYYDGCKKLFQQYQDLEASIRKAEAEIEATIRVAAIYSVGLGDMGQLLERFRALQPKVKVAIEYLHPDRVYEQVMGENVDFGLVSFPHSTRDLLAIPWREEEMVVTCPPDHPLARSGGVRPSQLTGENYVAFDYELLIRRRMDRFLRRHGAAVMVTHEFDNIESIKQAIEEGAGLALLPEPTVRREAEAGTLAALPLVGCRMVRPLGIIKHRHHQLSRTALRFIELLRKGNGDETAKPARSGKRKRSGRRQVAHANRD
jgi:DNA-binding transcriptional LysR family regulator